MAKKLLLTFILQFTAFCIYAQSGNNCASAIVVSTFPYGHVYTTCGAGNDYSGGGACEWPDNSGADVIYSFTPATTDVYYLNLTLNVGGAGTSGANIVVATTCAFNSACSANYINIPASDPFTPNTAGSVTMNAGVTYYIKIDHYTTTCCPYTFTIDKKPVVAGSTCSVPRTLYVRTTCAPGVFPANSSANVLATATYAGTGGCSLNESGLNATAFSNATQDAPCAGNDLTQKATWVKFRATDISTRFNNNNTGANRDLDYAVYVGGCVSPTFVNCFTVAGGGSQSFVTVPGTEYLVMITAAQNNTAAPNTHWLCITSTTPTALNPFDFCNSAFPLVDGVPVIGNLANATVDGYSILCGANAIPNNNVWYKWTCPSSWPAGQQAFFHVKNQDCNNQQGLQIDIYTPDRNCGNISGGSPSCLTFTAPGNTNNFFAAWNPTPGQTYFCSIDGSCGTACTFDVLINSKPVFAIPLQLISFVARRTAKGNELLWTTASEKSLSNFEIERSTNGKDFVSIAKIEAHGNTSIRHDYKYIDSKAKGLSYYRLKEVEYSHLTNYSRIVSVFAENFHRPFTAKMNENSVDIVLQDLVSSDLHCILNNTSGEIVYEKSISLAVLDSGVSIVLNTGFLRTGVYFLSINSKDQLLKQNIKLIK